MKKHKTDTRAETSRAFSRQKHNKFGLSCQKTTEANKQEKICRRKMGDAYRISNLVQKGTTKPACGKRSDIFR